VINFGAAELKGTIAPHLIKHHASWRHTSTFLTLTLHNRHER